MKKLCELILGCCLLYSAIQLGECIGKHKSKLPRKPPGEQPGCTKNCHCDLEECQILSRSFSVDYKNNCFLKDGLPFRYASGTVLYFRVPHQLWHDRIYKMKLAGLNAIDTYVEWSLHEPEPGVYDFDGRNDLPKFLQTAKDLDMLVILRAGPFIDAERDMGGLPYWLLRIDPNMKLRSYDDKYIQCVDRWYEVLLPLMEPFLYNNGGPIIMVQIENEYGSTNICDAQYKSHLRDFFLRYLKHNVVLFTTDGSGNNYLMCGRTDQVLSTFDYGTGTNVSSMVNLMRWNRASGPIVNSEFYTGWLDHWGQPHAYVDTNAIVETLTDMLAVNMSINFYVFHGGTSFGFTAGSNLGQNFQACSTSYDYDAPLSEAGDPTPKYYAIREVVGKFLPLPSDPVPVPAPKMETDNIPLIRKISLWDYISVSSDVVTSSYPMCFEDLYQPYGFVLYTTTVNFTTTDPAVLTVKGIADRGYVYVNKILQGILSREQKVYSLPIQAMKGDPIDILVENQGRVCYGSGIADRKGILQNVTLGSKTLLNWEMRPIRVDRNALQLLCSLQPANSDAVPAFYVADFKLDPIQTIYDTFLKVDGWHKGVAFLNNFNLGRYWPIVGPQVTLYAPGTLFKEYPELNQIILLELEHAPSITADACSVKFVKEPILNGTTPSTN